MTDYEIVQTATPNQEVADKIISALLEKRLIACAQTAAINSHYIWENKIQHNAEIMVTLKCKQADYTNIEKTILENHPYEVFEIISFKIDKAHEAYLNWISEVTEK